MRAGHLVGIPAGLFISLLLVAVFENAVRHVHAVPPGFDATLAADWLHYLASTPLGAPGYFALQWAVAAAGGLALVLVVVRRSPVLLVGFYCGALALFAFETLRRLGFPTAIGLCAAGGIAAAAVVVAGTLVAVRALRSTGTAADESVDEVLPHA